MERNPSQCEAHLYMSDGMKEIKTLTLELTRGQQAIENSVIKLTANFDEMQRINQRLEAIVEKQSARDTKQDDLINQQRDFMNKALGVIGAISFLVPVLINFLSSYFKH